MYSVQAYDEMTRKNLQLTQALDALLGEKDALLGEKEELEADNRNLRCEVSDLRFAIEDRSDDIEAYKRRRDS